MSVEQGEAAIGVALASRPPACLAPFSSMYLDQRGTVRVCCINSTYPLGNVTTSRLLDLWQGEEMAHLRRAMEAHDYRSGCDLCAPPEGLELHPTAPARTFDRLAATAGPWPRQLELALSNTCNLQCEMCFGELSSSIRHHREGLPPLPQVYDDAFFEDLELFLPHLEQLRFIGGEPFLSREAWRLWQRLDELGRHPRCHVTTNATVRTRRVEWVLDTFPTTLTVSLDGATAASFERIRRGARFADVVANLDHFRAKLADQGPRAVTVAFCLTTDTWQELPAVLRFAEERGLEVGVNLVTEPARLSLWRSPAETLATVARTWEAQADDVAVSLDLNRQVWLDNLAWARGAASSATREEGVAVHLGRSPLQQARLLASEHAAGGPVLEVELDGEDRITAVVGADAIAARGLVVAPHALVGRPLIALLSGPVVDQFGSAFTSHLEDRHGRRVRFHEMTFAGHAARSVQIVSVPAASSAPGRAYLTIAP